MILTIIKLFRVNQYVKNLFIFVPLFFAGKFTDIDLLVDSIIAFISFCLVASGVYILNDIKDVENDKKHPKKRYRPLPSGKISKKFALILMGGGITVGLFLMFITSIKATIILIAYILVNILYSFGLKQIAIIDISVISLGFIFRLFIGSAVSKVELSPWIVVITFLLALFLALAKRRDDVLIFLNTSSKLRKSIDGYNLEFINISMAITASIVILSYILWSIEAISKFNYQYLYLTSFWVVIGIMRYLQITFVEQNSGSPTDIVLKDRFIQGILIGWLLHFYLVIYK